MALIRLQSITTESILKYFFVSAGIILIVFYTAFQARLLIAGPQITLDYIPQITQTDRQITLEGIAKNITDITLNGRNIVTTKEGHFSESIVLQNGYTVVSIKAHDRYGRETRLDNEFVYTPFSSLLN